MDDEATRGEEQEELRKRIARDNDALQSRIETLASENDKIAKSKRKLQSEVEDLNVELESHRSQFSAMEKKQRKFDQNLAEEKSISER